MSKILIIENEQSAYDKIVDSIPGYDFLPKKGDFIDTKDKIQTNLKCACECISDLIKQNCSDLRCIICDLKLSSVKGKEIIHYIRKQFSMDNYPDFNKFVPIIAYTQFTDANLLEDALKEGADAALRKNVTSEYLKYIVERQVEQFSDLCNKFILKKPYRVGITFCGKDARPFVKELANSLAVEFSKHKVFFDEFHEEKLKSLSADEILEKIYTQQCEYVVLFMSKNYQKNYWTGKVEWEAIRNKLIPNRKDTIIPVLYDENAKVDGINLRKDIAIKVSQKYPKENLKPQELAEQIREIIKNK